MSNYSQHCLPSAQVTHFMALRFVSEKMSMSAEFFSCFMPLSDKWVNDTHSSVPQNYVVTFFCCVGTLSWKTVQPEHVVYQISCCNYFFVWIVNYTSTLVENNCVACIWWAWIFIQNGSLPANMIEAPTSSSILKQIHFRWAHEVVILFTYSSMLAQSFNLVFIHCCNRDTFLLVPEFEKAFINASHAPLTVVMPSK